ncbi:MAG: amidohydrolase family protein [Candidatus Dormibacteraceae bacterium]
MKYIDAHVHAFPSPEMGFDWQEIVGMTNPKRAGVLGELEPLLDEAGIELVVLLLFARSGEHYRQLRQTRPEAPEAEIRAQVAQEIRDYNRWGVAAAGRDPRLIPFVGINVRYLDADEIRAEIDELVALGARGVKIIPPSMGLYGDDPLLDPLWQRCWELQLPVLTQSGDGGGPPPGPGQDHFGRPSHHEPTLRNFPGLTLILAHLGHGYTDDVVSLTQRYENVYTDTSFQFSNVGREGGREVRELVDSIRRMGTDKVLLGSNFPMVNPAGYVRTLQQLPFSDAERAQIGADNARRCLRLGTSV